MTDETQLVALHKRSMHNRQILDDARICGCFYCLSEFKSDQIEEWIDNNDTAMCPRCGIDAVLGFETSTADKDLLLQMQDRWFGGSLPKNWNSLL